jgi:hypothetical protein
MSGTIGAAIAAGESDARVVAAMSPDRTSDDIESIVILLTTPGPGKLFRDGPMNDGNGPSESQRLM